MSGVVYAVGGQSSGAISGGTYNEAYYPISNTWNTKATMPTGRGNLAAAALNGTIYAIGGNTSSAMTVTEAYNPVANSWSTRAAMPTARACLAVAAPGSGALYAIGGCSSSNWTSNEAYLAPLYVYRKD